MKWLHRLPLVLALLMLGSQGAGASTAYGDLNNFDTVNDTGQLCHGFEIEIDDIHSTDITYTYDWNHYGAPRIREDNTDPVHPKVFIRYESAKNTDGTWAAHTAVPAAPLAPTDGHFCTDPTVNLGCEHFGVGYYGVPTTVRYNWLLDDGVGNLIHGPAVNVATPSFVYSPPVLVDQNLPPDPGNIAQPAQVVAAIPAPVAPIPIGMQFGEPAWVKVIKTISHNANNIALGDLVSRDIDGDGAADWQNGEPDQVETEWKLLQTNSAGNAAKDELQGLADDMGDGSETVTRRYEFYRYVRYVRYADPLLTDPADSLDGETGEAMCSEINPTTDTNDPNYLHGSVNENNVGVTDANGDTYYIDCSAQVMIGDYIGAQMAGFDAAAPLGLVDNIQDGDRFTSYTPRTIVVGGNSPYAINITQGNLPPGLVIDDYIDPNTGATAHGVLSGTPTAAGGFTFTVEATDADNLIVSKAYTMMIAGGIVPQYQLSVGKTGAGTVAGSGIDCGTTCVAMLNEGTTATLTATPAAGSLFSGWSGACTGSGDCIVVVNADTSVSAAFTQQYELVVSKAGSGAGTVTGNGIDCGLTCTLYLDTGTAVSLTATPVSGSVFTGWSGDCSGTGSCNTTMNAARLVTATFVPSTQPYTLAVTTSGKGSVRSSPKGINCGKQCSKTFTVGTEVTLTAKPTGRHLFLGWSGACTGTSLTCTVPMAGDQSVHASFN